MLSDWPVIGAVPPRIHLSDPRSARTTVTAWFVRHGTERRPRPLLRDVSGIVVTGVVRTTADIASTTDLVVAVPIVDHVLRTSTASVTALLEATEALASATTKAREAISLGSALAESPAESLCRVRFHQRSSVLVVGGRSGVGKSSAASALHDLLSARRIRHAVIEGDTLDLAWPAPWEHGDDMAARNLAAVWGNYRSAGHRRLVYTNTVSVLEARHLSAAMGDDLQVVAVLLRASDATVAERLSRRESGASLTSHLERSRARAAQLDAEAGPEVHRVETDGRSAPEVAVELAALTGWC